MPNGKNHKGNCKRMKDVHEVSAGLEKQQHKINPWQQPSRGRNLGQIS